MNATPQFLVRLRSRTETSWLAETPQTVGDPERSDDVRKAAVHTYPEMLRAVDDWKEAGANNNPYTIQAFELDPTTLAPKDLWKPRNMYPPERILP